MNATTYYQRNRDVILNRSKDYYKNHKERFRDNARDKYRNLSEEENMEEIDTIICLKKKIQKLKLMKLIKTKSLNLRKKIHDYIHSKLLILLNFFFYLDSLS